MRLLGYPRLVSMESFRMPNFSLLADILLWLVKSYDPTAEIPDDIDTEQDRIIFVKSVALFMAPKAHIKLNTRRLYMADGSCVRELAKIVDLLHEAVAMRASDAGEETARIHPLDISSKLPQLKTCRLLATEITERGAKLYDSLGHELLYRDIRSAIISRPFELGAMESSVKSSIRALVELNTTTRTTLANLAADESNLISKIDKKKIELERAQKRLLSLQSVRPAYMDEYERIEKDLGALYNAYMEKFRNVTYLEQQLDEHNRVEQDKFEETEESLKKMQMKLQEEEMRLLRGDKDLGSVYEDVGRGNGSGQSPAREGGVQLTRPKGAGHRSRSFKTLSGTGSDSASPTPSSPQTKSTSRLAKHSNMDQDGIINTPASALDDDDDDDNSFDIDDGSHSEGSITAESNSQSHSHHSTGHRNNNTHNKHANDDADPDDNDNDDDDDDDDEGHADLSDDFNDDDLEDDDDDDDELELMMDAGRGGGSERGLGARGHRNGAFGEEEEGESGEDNDF
ncbi:Clusterin-associated protein-1-domain-containing protein [Powellomyces hirtus]|nr:Clusterin-associated protein-1-domain-containing protein [Powellomyces hirtus]